MQRFVQKAGGARLFDYRPVDALFHLVAARRNVALLLLTAGALCGQLGEFLRARSVDGGDVWIPQCVSSGLCSVRARRRRKALNIGDDIADLRIAESICEKRTKPTTCKYMHWGLCPRGRSPGHRSRTTRVIGGLPVAGQWFGGNTRIAVGVATVAGSIE